MVPRTVQVEIECNGEPSGGGSAVLLGGNKALTARHVIDEAEGCSVRLHNDSGVDVRAIKAVLDDEADLAMLTLERALMAPDVTLAQGRLGDHVYVVGYPVNLTSNEQQLNVTEGVVAAYNYTNGEDRLTAPVYFGNSGGPVFNERGELVGIAVSIMAARLGGWPLPYDGVATMVPYGAIRDLMVSCRN